MTEETPTTTTGDTEADACIPSTNSSSVAKRIQAQSLQDEQSIEEVPIAKVEQVVEDVAKVAIASKSTWEEVVDLYVSLKEWVKAFLTFKALWPW